MAKNYTRKHIGSIKSLNKEQDRIARVCKELEKDMFSGIFNPQTIALNVATGLFSRIGKNKEKKQKTKAGKDIQPKKAAAKPIQSFVSAEGDSPSPIVNVARNLIANPTVKGLLRRTAISWVRWQAFNLALYLGKKAYKAVKHKREENKLNKQLAALNDLSTRR